MEKEKCSIFFASNFNSKIKFFIFAQWQDAFKESVIEYRLSAAANNNASTDNKRLRGTARFDIS